MPIELPALQELRMDLRPPNVGDGVAMAALIADPTRAGILAMLAAGPTACASSLLPSTSARTTSATTWRRLRDAGLVRVSRGPADGRRVYYERDEAACAAAAARVAEILG